MNHYGALARKHWAKYRPSEYGSMSDPESFFTDLGEQMAEQVLTLSRQLEGDDPAGETYLDKVGRLNMARLMAEEQVMRETLPVAEDDEQ